MSEEPIKPEDLEEPLTPEPSVPEMAQAELEARARRQGWRPKEEYRGPEERWVPAQEFLERGERVEHCAARVERAALQSCERDLLRQQLAAIGRAAMVTSA